LITAKKPAKHKITKKVPSKKAPSTHKDNISPKIIISSKNKSAIFDPHVFLGDKVNVAQHQEISKLVNELIGFESKDTNLVLRAIRKTIHHLHKYTSEHFSYEEFCMEKANYPKVKEHKKEHHKFRKKFEKLKNQLDSILYAKSDLTLTTRKKLHQLLHKLEVFLVEWWENHMFKIKKSKQLVREILRKEKVNSDQSSFSSEKKDSREWVLTGIPGFDSLMENGIPRGTSLLVSGGPGSGKTIFCLQTIAHAANNGEKCLYLSFEESEDRLKKHMEDFGWDWKKLEKKGLLRIIRKEPFGLTTNLEAMLAKAKGELLINLNEILEIIPKDFKPHRIVFDSLTAIAATFDQRGKSYRIFIEQLFKYLESLGITSFMISEAEQIPLRYSEGGVEEFLADGVIVLYAIKKGDIRENAVEIIKLRGAKHQKKTVAFGIDGGGY